jgi:hypothetical protein
MATLDADLEGKIEAYLLGRLSEEEQARIEALLFEGDDVFEAIRDAEDDLIDRYLAGDLTQADRDAFEHGFATTITRQERIALARALLHAAGSSARVQTTPAEPAPAAPVPAEPASAEPAPVQRTRPTATRRPIVAAGAALAAALVVAIAWRLIARDHLVSPPVRDDATTQPAVATLSLSRSDVRRGAGNLPRLVVRPGTTAVRLEPELEAPIPVGGYAVTLRRVEGPVVWRGSVDVDGDRPSVTVPARFAGAGDYVLSLAAPGAPPEDSAEYPFRVITRN